MHSHCPGISKCTPAPPRRRRNTCTFEQFPIKISPMVQPTFANRDPHKAYSCRTSDNMVSEEQRTTFVEPFPRLTKNCTSFTYSAFLSVSFPQNPVLLLLQTGTVQLPLLPSTKTPSSTSFSAFTQDAEGLMSKMPSNSIPEPEKRKPSLTSVSTHPA